MYSSYKRKAKFLFRLTVVPFIALSVQLPLASLLQNLALHQSLLHHNASKDFNLTTIESLGARLVTGNRACGGCVLQ